MAAAYDMKDQYKRHREKNPERPDGAHPRVPPEVVVGGPYERGSFLASEDLGLEEFRTRFPAQDRHHVEGVERRTAVKDQYISSLGLARVQTHFPQIQPGFHRGIHAGC